MVHLSKFAHSHVHSWSEYCCEGLGKERKVNFAFDVQQTSNSEFIVWAKDMKVDSGENVLKVLTVHQATWAGYNAIIINSLGWGL